MEMENRIDEENADLNTCNYFRFFILNLLGRGKALRGYEGLEFWAGLGGLAVWEIQSQDFGHQIWSFRRKETRNDDCGARDGAGA